MSDLHGHLFSRDGHSIWGKIYSSTHIVVTLRFIGLFWRERVKEREGKKLPNE